ncbi:uncharacterized protein [Venturia canescens]|uniref:uncharacterized protein n=1 Tax=Venturia canescens TaxID=32260 RepID=UPI001C9CE6CB|nr:uncharacterized protein LOC122413244 [Venturia canescens]XP_043279390.1 uncharacterized protein LOC122413244 [Venturia canescens]
MLLAGMRKLCRVCLAAVLATALCVLTLVDMPPQLPEPPTDPPPTPETESSGTRSIVAYSWARRLALDYRPSVECRDYVNEHVTAEDEKFTKSSDAYVTSKESSLTRNRRRNRRRTRRRINEKEDTDGGIDDTKRSNKWLETIPRRLFLYSAHLDIRVAGYPSVRVIGVKRETSSTLLRTAGTLYCTIWHADVDGVTKSFSMEALVSDIWLDEWGGSQENYTGILVTCQLPRVKGPLRVYVGTRSCYQNPSHSLLVKAPPENDKKVVKESDEFSICIKGLDFDEDISEKLVAFVELNRILGANMIYVYVFNVHENVSKVLRMYEKSNVVRWFNFELPGDLPNDIQARRQLLATDLWTKRRMELIPYNHCFYENLYTANFVVPIDIDETIIPIKRDNWRQLLNDERSKLGRSFNDFASYAVRNAYFFTEMQNKIRPRMTKFSHDLTLPACNNCEDNSTTCVYLDTVRTSVISPIGDSVKSFVSTKRALTVHNHYALTTLDPSTTRAYHLHPRDALKHHHRMCDQTHLDCNLMMQQLKIDDSALRYAQQLKARMKLFYGRS